MNESVIGIIEEFYQNPRNYVLQIHGLKYSGLGQAPKGVMNGAEVELKWKLRENKWRNIDKDEIIVLNPAPEKEPDNEYEILHNEDEEEEVKDDDG